MDYRFCFPVRIDLGHRDYLRIFLITAHFSSLALMLASIGLSGGAIAGMLVLSGSMVSLRYYLDQQRTIYKYQVLYGISDHHWELERPDGKKSMVKLERVALLGPFLIIKLRRFGESLSWATTESHQHPKHWHRMRILTRFY